MSTQSQHTSSPPDAYSPLTPSEELEQAASKAELGAGVALRGVEIVAASLLALLLCPPLLILAVVVAVPAVAFLTVAAVVGAVVAAPYLLVRRLRGHHSPHPAEFAARVRHAGHALVDLLPHRVAGAAPRKG